MGPLLDNLRRLAAARLRPGWRWLVVLVVVAAGCGGHVSAGGGAPAASVPMKGVTSKSPAAPAKSAPGTSVPFTASEFAKVKATFASNGCSTLPLAQDQPPAVSSDRSFLCQWQNTDDQVDFVVTVILFSSAAFEKSRETGVAQTDASARFARIAANLVVLYRSPARDQVMGVVRALRA